MALYSSDTNAPSTTQIEGEEPPLPPRAEQIKKSNSRFTHAEIMKFHSSRPDLRGSIGKLPGPSERRDQAIKEMLIGSYDSEHERIGLLLNFKKELAGVSFNEGRYDVAIEGYKSAITDLVNEQYKPGVLLRRFYNQNYLLALISRPFPYQIHIFLDLVSSCNNIALSYTKLNMIPQAMDWLQETEVLYECLRYNTIGIYSKLQVMRVPFIEFATYRMKATLRCIHIFLQLGNTAAATYFAWRMTIYGYWFPKDVPEIKSITEQCDFDRLLSFRHPDPRYLDTWSAEYAELQLRGIWSKIKVPLNVRLPSSPLPNSWIWKSRLYVRWGTAEFNQLWYLNLKETRIWHRLTPFPKHLYALQPSFANPLVYKDHVWFFAGSTEILRFNLVSEKWDSVHTTFSGKWPFSMDHFVLSATCIYNIEKYLDKMCVFGGLTDRNSLFMLLDLTKLTWRYFDLAHRSSSDVRQDLPLGRSGGNSWVVEDEDKLYIMYGDIDTEDYETNAVLKEPLIDLWSFSFRSEMWTRERLRGNFPSPRITMAHAYHNGLKKVVVFGGISDRAPACLDEGKFSKETDYSLTYYADTFVMDIESNNWQQIVTRSFPAWRGSCNMMIDESDGRIYVYGGLSHGLTLFGPDSAKASKICAFRDIWQLDLDLPGHYFDAETYGKVVPFKAGSYRRCFSCLKIGMGYFRCRGTCGGRSIYCSHDCQTKAWKAHKTIYGCRK